MKTLMSFSLRVRSAGPVNRETVKMVTANTNTRATTNRPIPRRQICRYWPAEQTMFDLLQEKRQQYLEQQRKSPPQHRSSVILHPEKM